jgi:uncharacterized membrane protein (Fun14 family)
MATGPQSASRRLNGLQRGVVGVTSAVLLASVAARVWFHYRPGVTEAVENVADAGEAYLRDAGQATLPPPPDSSALETALPYLTEGSAAGLLGFAVGYATRKVVRVLLVLVGVLVVGLQLLSSQGIVDVDWGAALGLVNDAVLDVSGDRTLGETLRDRLPPTGAFAGGLFVGFRRG